MAISSISYRVDWIDFSEWLDAKTVLNDESTEQIYF
jgi:hypothetical protein